MRNSLDVIETESLNPDRIRERRKAHEILNAFMHSQTADCTVKVRSGASPKDDIFSMQIRANEGGKLFLDDSELVSRPSLHGLDARLTFNQIGNVFVLLLAGHGMCLVSHNTSLESMDRLL
jgi:hypothetical protein